MGQRCDVREGTAYEGKRKRRVKINEKEENTKVYRNEEELGRKRRKYEKVK